MSGLRKLSDPSRLWGQIRPFNVGAPCHAVGVDAKAAVQTVEGVESSVAALAVFVREAAGVEAGSGPLTGAGSLAGGHSIAGADSLDGSGAGPGGDPLRDQADAWLDALAEAARLEARVAALKVQAAAGFAAAEAALAAPDVSRPERDVLEMSVTAEVAGALTVSEGSAARFLEESARLSRDLPLTLAALGAGTLSWQHARIMCDETDGLSPEAAAAFEAHFLDPDAPGRGAGLPGRGADSGEVSGEGPVLAGKASSGQHRNTARQECEGSAAGVCPGPGRHGLVLGVPASGPGGGDLEPHHRRRPRHAGPHRNPDPDPAARRRLRHVAARPDAGSGRRG